MRTKDERLMGELFKEFRSLAARVQKWSRSRDGSQLRRMVPGSGAVRAKLRPRPTTQARSAR